MFMEEYKKALRQGQRDYRSCLAQGIYPYLQVLNEIMPNLEEAKRVELGLVDIPMERIVGTLTQGRSKAFSRNFLPLLEPDSEFADKWAHLCQAQSDEGIRDPVKAFEYMNHFYIQEGNKRVSVLKQNQNAYDAYELMLRLDPASVDDLLKAHKLMMNGLVSENGKFRSGGVGVFDGDMLIHMAPPAEFVELMLEIIRDSLTEVTVVGRSTDQHSDQVADQDKTPTERLLYVLSDKTLSATELMDRLGLSHKPTFRKNYLNPALKQNLIERTIPDKPNSRNQKYRKCKN